MIVISAPNQLRKSRGTDNPAYPLWIEGKLVDTKLEMVRAYRLPYNHRSIPRLHWFNPHDRF
jgi:hypothetical protein